MPAKEDCDGHTHMLYTYKICIAIDLINNVTYPLPNTKGILQNNSTIANTLARPDRNPNIPIDKMYLDT